VALEQAAQFAIIISSVGAIGLLVFLYFQLQQTKKSLMIARGSLELTREEVTRRLRPWVGQLSIDLSGVRLNDGKWLTGKEFSNFQDINRSKNMKELGVQDLTFRFLYKNYGELPAQKLTVRGITRKGEQPKESDLENLTSIGYSVLMPGGSSSAPFSISGGDFDDASDGITNFWSIFSIDYEYDRSKGYLKAVMQLEGNTWIFLTAEAR